MDALNIGPLLIGSERLLVGIGLVVMLLAAYSLSRREHDSDLRAWAWNAAFVGVISARVGFVALHLDVYLADPASMLYIWQGGFEPLSGLAGGALYSVYMFHRRPRLLGRASLAAVAGIAGWLAGVLALQPSAITGVEDSPLPAVSVYRLEDRSPLALNELVGTPLVINIWATWCPPCRREMPLLARTAASNPDVRFLFVDQGESEQTVREYLAGLPCELSGVVLDPRRQVGAATGVIGLPTTLFYDASGRLRRRQIGELSRAALRDHLAAIKTVDASDAAATATGGADPCVKEAS